MEPFNNFNNIHNLSPSFAFFASQPWTSDSSLPSQLFKASQDEHTTKQHPRLTHCLSSKTKASWKKKVSRVPQPQKTYHNPIPQLRFSKPLHAATEPTYQGQQIIPLSNRKSKSAPPDFLRDSSLSSKKQLPETNSRRVTKSDGTESSVPHWWERWLPTTREPRTIGT